ncbi:MAG: hypothetical protein ACE3JN_05520 [Ectobacillus sp.]
MKRKAATPAGKAARPHPRKASACSGKSTIQFNRAKDINKTYSLSDLKFLFCLNKISASNKNYQQLKRKEAAYGNSIIIAGWPYRRCIILVC